MERKVSNNFQSVSHQTESCVKKRRLQDVHGQLLTSVAIKTQDHDFVKFSKKASSINFQDKVLETLNGFGKLGKSASFYLRIFICYLNILLYS